MATHQMIDMKRFKTQLEKFDALRDTDDIKTGSLPPIQQTHSEYALRMVESRAKVNHRICEIPKS